MYSGVWSRKCSLRETLYRSLVFFFNTFVMYTGALLFLLFFFASSSKMTVPVCSFVINFARRFYILHSLRVLLDLHSSLCSDYFDWFVLNDITQFNECTFCSVRPFARLQSPSSSRLASFFRPSFTPPFIIFILFALITRCSFSFLWY